MYRGWAERRHMRVREICSTEQTTLPILDIAGFGAFRVLNEEAGLHVWEEGEGSRLVARVRVCEGPIEIARGSDAYRRLEQLLVNAGDGASIARRYRQKPDTLVRDARKGWRSGRLNAVLAGDFDLIGPLSEA
jgi:ATP-dependent Clp protease ATP-binding subunit ClpC